MTALAPSVITATVDTLAGQRVEDATLAVRQIVRLACGCLRYECDRPGGGIVHILVGEHCADNAGRDVAVPALAGVA